MLLLPIHAQLLLNVIGLNTRVGVCVCVCEPKVHNICCAITFYDRSTTFSTAALFCFGFNLAHSQEYIASLNLAHVLPSTEPAFSPSISLPKFGWAGSCGHVPWNAFETEYYFISIYVRKHRHRVPFISFRSRVDLLGGFKKLNIFIDSDSFLLAWWS